MQTKPHYFLIASLLILLTGCAPTSSKQPTNTSTTLSMTKTSSPTPSTEKSQTTPTFPTGSLLAAAAQKDTAKVTVILKDTQYPINEVDAQQNTALHIAVQQNEIDMAKQLIDHGASINQQNAIQDSPYLYAGAEGRTEILAYMLTHATPDFAVHNRFGGNALIPAAEKGHLANVKLLVEDGRENINFQNNYGYTALIEAVGLREGTKIYQEIVQYLLAHGADKQIKDNSGRTAFDYAKQKGYTELSTILAQYP